MAAALADALRAVVGSANLVADAGAKSPYEHDLTGRFSGTALVVVRPADAAEVAECVRICAARRQPLVAQGGNTGMVGGQVPRPDEVVLSLERLTSVDEVEPLAGQVTVGAGVTLEALQQHALTYGLEFPVDHAARSKATIGGMVATNAGGALAARFGMTRAYVTGLEAVLPDGTVVSRLSGLVKDTAGYDWTSLLVGSEGTLAIVTAVRVRLVPAATRRAVALFALESLGRALELLQVLRASASIRAADFFLAGGLDLVCEVKGIVPPFAARHPVYLVVESAAAGDAEAELAEAAVQGEELFVDAAVASDSAGREGLWLYREAHNECIAASGVPHKLDVSVDPTRTEAFVADVSEAIAETWPAARTICYGHLGDGNVHVNVLGPDPDDERVDDVVLRRVAAFGGSIAAEHGIGVAKARWLGLTRSEAEIELMRALKAALDPSAILGRGRVLPPDGAA
jgi:FAD/FMN-containing dehydrogenase